MLNFLYRTMNVQFSIAGTGPVQTGDPKVVNVNLTHIVSHFLRAVLDYLLHWCYFRSRGKRNTSTS